MSNDICKSTLVKLTSFNKLSVSNFDIVTTRSLSLQLRALEVHIRTAPPTGALASEATRQPQVSCLAVVCHP